MPGVIPAMRPLGGGQMTRGPHVSYIWDSPPPNARAHRDDATLEEHGRSPP
jgi:hypothetical protein